MFCKICGAFINDKVQYCGGCGTLVSDATGAGVLPHVAAPQQPSMLAAKPPSISELNSQSLEQSSEQLPVERASSQHGQNFQNHQNLQYPNYPQTQAQAPTGMYPPPPPPNPISPMLQVAPSPDVDAQLNSGYSAASDSGYVPVGNDYNPFAAFDAPAETFVDRVFSITNSSLFFIAVLLFTISGSILVLMNFGIASLLTLEPVIMILAMVGFWMIFSASKDPRNPKRVLSALTVFKVAIIMGLVIFCIAMGIILLALLILTVVGFVTEPIIGIISILGILFLVMLIVIMILFYYMAVLNIIGGIRRNIEHNAFKPIRGVLPFTIISAIGIFFELIGAILMLIFAGLFSTMMGDLFMMGDLAGYVDPHMFDTSMMGIFSGIFAVTAIIGGVMSIAQICFLVLLNKLNSGLKGRA
ncbi:MAG: hypothetical protein FWC89_03380 [Defluviitaleaceae bacterium]|nr:hypothetical protein [Defluviitaleaceae bacterium]